VPTFVSTDVLNDRLTSFLDGRGITLENLIGEADQGVGAPVLVVASGSVLAGFGNPTSDIDLHVLVDSAHVSALPITTHNHGCLVDVSFKSVHGALDACDRLRSQSWPPATVCTREDWLARQRDIDQISRFALGLPVAGEPKWRDWQFGLREQWLIDVIRDWWTVEAVRLRTAAGWLARVNPRLAALRARQAVLAALEARMVAAGHAYFRGKWIAEKLIAAGDSDDLAVLRELLAGFARPDYLAWCDDQVRRLTGTGDDYDWYLCPAGGVSSFGAGDVRVVSRWGMRMTTVPARFLDHTGRGAVGERPADHLLNLFVEDMLWLSTVAR
jgi:hypothetical protein